MYVCIYVSRKEDGGTREIFGEEDEVEVWISTLYVYSKEYLDQRVRERAQLSMLACHIEQFQMFHIFRALSKRVFIVRLEKSDPAMAGRCLTSIILRISLPFVLVIVLC